MKIYKMLLGALVCVYMLGACDVIDKPYMEKVDPNPVDTTKEVRKVFLEDYTGFTCTNCPKAAAAITEAHELYGDKVISIAVHAGFYAKPKVAPSIFTYDFRTEEGTILDKFFGISAVGNPNGMMNRIGYTDKSHIVEPSSWVAKAAELLKQEAKIKISLTPKYDAANKKIGVDAVVKYLSAGAANHKICAIVVEDSIVDAQISSGKEIPNYVHNHVLRASFNGAWGEALSAAAIPAGTTINKSFSMTIPTTDTKHPWNPNHLKIVVYVQDDGASYEVLQVEEVKLVK
jgi:hypothetical protein